MQNNPIYTKSALAPLIWRLFVVMIIFSIIRLIFYTFNKSYFNEPDAGEILLLFLYGLRFDLSAVLLINLPVIFFSTIPFKFRSKKAFGFFVGSYFFIINSLAIAVNLIDVIYFRFTLKRTTADILNYLSTGDDFAGLIPVFLKDFWYILLIWFAMIALLVFLAGKVRSANRRRKTNNLRYYFIHSAIFLVTIFFTIIGIRGGFQLRPLSIIVAGKYTTAKNVPLVLNTPYSFLTTINKSTISLKYYFTKKELEAIYTPYHTAVPDSLSKRKNVVIIIVESLSTEHVGALNTSLENGTYKGHTPFLDSLIRHSIVYKGFANGKRSMEGIPAILSAIPSLMNDAYITSPYSGNNVKSIAGLLKERSYSSSFFHGGNNGTMGFDNYANIAGFDRYHGRNEYNNEDDFDGKWGIFDEEFLQYAAVEINSTDTPFVAAIFTLSSHHPYTIPEKHNRRFGTGKLKIQQSIEYADYSIGKFFETAKKMPWYENTLFVITADHTSESYYPYYKTTAGMFAIPIIFFDPRSNHGEIKNEIAQQTDILPSILNYLNYDNDFIAFGSSVFDANAPRFSINFVNNNYQLIKDDYLLTFNGEKTTGFYNIANDSLLNNDVIKNDIPEMYQMENFAKAVIQQYNNRLIENRLSVR